MSSRHDDITEPGPPRLEEVSEDIHAYVQPDGTWWINNTGVVVGPQGVTAIDSCSTERRTRATPVQGLFGVVEIVAAADGTCARLGDGETKCWGNDDAGQLAWPALPPGALNVPMPIRYMSPAAR